MKKIFLLISLLFLMGCESDSPISNSSGQPIIKMASGQVIEFVHKNDFQGWASLHTNDKIVAITAYSNSITSTNPTTDLLIVYIPANTPERP